MLSDQPGIFDTQTSGQVSAFKKLRSGVIASTAKFLGNLLRLEMRHPFAKRYGINPSMTYEKNSGVTTIDATGYARVHAAYAGVRLGNESTHQGRGGFFATAFVGWSRE